MHKFCLSAAVAIGSLILLRPATSLAVITSANPDTTTGLNDSQPSGVAGWNYVGTVNGASGVYIGNGWVLTADHVGAGNFYLDGTTYDWNGQPEVRLQNSDSTAQNPDPTDLVLFKLKTAPALASLNVATTNPAYGTSFTAIGYGLARNTVEQEYDYNSSSETYSVSSPYGEYTGFGYSGSGVKSWGTNELLGFDSYNIGYGNVDAFYSDFYSGTSQIINGDSGGGVFNAQGQLIGINDAISEFPNQSNSSVVLFGDESFYVDVADYSSQIISVTGISVPEPSSVALLGLGGMALLARRRRRQRAS